MEFKKQKHQYDCGVAATFNLLSNSWIEISYQELEKLLQTTTLWGTFPKNIDDTLKSYFSNKNFKIWILLIDWNKFYNDNIDYWHYINIIWFQKGKYKIFDPYDWRYYLLNKKDILDISKNVLVWKKTRYNDIILWNSFDLI